MTALPIGVDDARLTVDQREDVVAEADHHREPEPASHDGRVAGHAPHRERNPGHIAVELDDVGRPEIRRDQDGVTHRLPTRETVSRPMRAAMLVARGS